MQLFRTLNALTRLVDETALDHASLVNLLDGQAVTCRLSVVHHHVGGDEAHYLGEHGRALVARRLCHRDGCGSYPPADRAAVAGRRAGFHTESLSKEF
jgi:hypothetical protein